MALEVVQRLKEEAKTVAIDDKGTVFNQDVLGALELQFMLDNAEAIVRRRDRAQGEPRRPVPHRLPGAQRRGVAQAHQPSRRTASEPEISLLRGHHDPVGAPGEDLLDGWPTTRSRSAASTPSRARPPTGRTSTSTSTPERSVLDGILQVKDREDGSLAIRCSCQAAICGSCGVRINGKTALACNTQLGEAAARPRARRDRSSSSRWATCRCIKDLIVDMDAVHWKKVQRVVPWLLPEGDPPEREYIVPAEAMIDITQSMACIQCGACVRRLPVARGRPRVHRPRRARQGLPLRRRPARRRSTEERLTRPRRGPARHLRLHPLLRLRRGLPQGRGADEPDHAPAPHGDRRLRDQGHATTATATRRRSST